MLTSGKRSPWHLNAKWQSRRTMHLRDISGCPMWPMLQVEHRHLPPPQLTDCSAFNAAILGRAIVCIPMNVRNCAPPPFLRCIIVFCCNLKNQFRNAHPHNRFPAQPVNPTNPHHEARVPAWRFGSLGRRTRRSGAVAVESPSAAVIHATKR